MSTIVRTTKERRDTSQGDFYEYDVATEFHTTSAHNHGDDEIDPVCPDGDRWELVAMAATSARVYWSWRRYLGEV